VASQINDAFIINLLAHGSSQRALESCLMEGNCALASSKKDSVIAYMEKKNLEASLVFAVFLFGFLFNLWIFSRSRLITGVDGPYYLIQVRGLLTSGSLVYGDPPLTFYLLAFFSLLTGDITSGVKIGVSFFCALSTIPVFFFMKKVGKSRLSGFIAMLLIVFSAPLIRMMTDFMKNAIGICWFLFFLYYLHGLAFSETAMKKNLVLATFFLLLAEITHVLDFGFAFLFLMFYTVIAAFFNINRRRFLISAGILALATGVSMFLAATTFFSGNSWRMGRNSVGSVLRSISISIPLEKER